MLADTQSLGMGTAVGFSHSLDAFVVGPVALTLGMGSEEVFFHATGMGMEEDDLLLQGEYLLAVGGISPKDYSILYNRMKISKIN
jgi:hypothetical protein